MKPHLLFAGVAFAACALAGAAQASVYDFSYTASGGPSGTETGAGAITLSNTETDGYFKVLDVTGLANGSTITSLSGYAAADNDIFSSGPVVDLGGVSVATASGVDYNFYYSGGYEVLSSATDAVGYPANGSPVTNLNVSYVSSAVPEPSTWMLLIAGIGGIGLMLRQANYKRTPGLPSRSALAA